MIDRREFVLAGAAFVVAPPLVVSAQRERGARSPTFDLVDLSVWIDKARLPDAARIGEGEFLRPVHLSGFGRRKRLSVALSPANAVLLYEYMRGSTGVVIANHDRRPVYAAGLRSDARIFSVQMEVSRALARHMLIPEI